MPESKSRVTRKEVSEKLKQGKSTGHAHLVRDASPGKEKSMKPRRPTAEERRDFESANPDRGFGLGRKKGDPQRPAFKSTGPAKDIDEEMRRLGKKRKLR